MTSDPGTDVAVEQVLAQLRRLGSPQNVEGMKRYGVGGVKAFGVRAPDIRALARTIGLDDRLAADLWESGWREARLIGAMIADPLRTTPDRMDAWIESVDSWDVCDGVCNLLFRRTPHAWSKATEWARRIPTYVKRGGFVMMAQLAVHERSASDERFLALLPELERGALDPRPMVAKGVNWALRQIGKRSEELRLAAIDRSHRINRLDGARSRWIASDALRELQSDAVIRRISHTRKR